MMTIQRRETIPLPINSGHITSKSSNNFYPYHPSTSTEERPLISLSHSKVNIDRESTSIRVVDDNIQNFSVTTIDEVRCRDELRAHASKCREEMRKRRLASISNKICHYIIERTQGIHLPPRLSSFILRRTEDDNDYTTHSSGTVPLFRGIDKVVGGMQPASEVVLVCGLKPYRYFWYMLSGSSCDLIQLVIDFVVFRALQLEDPSICWALSLGLSVIFRHSFHRYLVFGPYVGGYCNSLMRMYTGYSIIIIISTMFNIVMTKIFHLTHYTAWMLTLLWSGIVNYFILKHVWSFGGEKRKRDKYDSAISVHHLRDSDEVQIAVPILQISS